MEDYETFLMTLTFVEANRQNCIDVPLLEDNSVEGTHTFSLQASHPLITSEGATQILIQDRNGMYRLTLSSDRD